MKTRLIALLMLTACHDPACFELEYNPDTELCECPAGTTPDYELDACVGPDGLVIPWSNIDPNYIAMGDAGPRIDSSSPFDMGRLDAGSQRDTSPLDSQMDTGSDTPDGGPPPPSPRLLAPWNGFNTGSVHASSVGPTTPLQPLLTWAPVDSAISYEVQMTTECETAMFRSCEFGSPSISEMVPATSFAPSEPLPVRLSAPVGERYFWRVRACGSRCSSWSEIRYLNVGRSAQDYNGDGYADAVVGAPDQNAIGGANSGSATVFFGGTEGSSSLWIGNPEPQEDARFGQHVAAAGDINADGYADLLVGAPGQEMTRGMVFVFLGGPSGPSLSPQVSLPNPFNQTGGFFGVVSSAGDTNADGFSDIAVGAPGQDFPEENEGVVFVYFGGDSAVETTPSVTIDCPSDSASARFGTAISHAGDVNSDGFSDMIVGAPFEDGEVTAEGAVYVFLGSELGPTGDPTRLGNPEHETRGEFGGVVSGGGDIEGDGYSDVVVGASRHDGRESNEGIAYVFHGDLAGIRTEPGGVITNPTHAAHGGFAASLSCSGDVNGDGYADIVVGAPGNALRGFAGGVVYVYFGSEGGTAAGPSRSLDNPTDERRGMFGVAVAMGDMNGSGYTDVVVGASVQNTTEEDTGAGYVFIGGVLGTAQTPEITLLNPFGHRNAFFGTTIAMGYIRCLVEDSYWGMLARFTNRTI